MVRKKPWQDEIDERERELPGPPNPRRQFFKSNQTATQRIVEGAATFAKEDAAAGVHAVANMSNAHIEDFCEASRKGDKRPYKNYYDLGNHLDEHGAPKPDAMRVAVDRQLPCPPSLQSDKLAHEKIVFAAAELNGSGVSFYGDFCLVLSNMPGSAVVLDRNSWEFTVAPFAGQSAKLSARFQLHSADVDALPEISFSRLVRENDVTHRLTVTEQVSDALLAGEDYVELLLPKSFGTQSVREARTSAQDETLEVSIRQRAANGDPGSEAELLWLDRRERAKQALSDANVPVCVVTRAGRSKS